jgi:hypothetical protein
MSVGHDNAADCCWACAVAVRLIWRRRDTSFDKNLGEGWLDPEERGEPPAPAPIRALVWHRKALPASKAHEH